MVSLPPILAETFYDTVIFALSQQPVKESQYFNIVASTNITNGTTTMKASETSVSDLWIHYIQEEETNVANDRNGCLQNLFCSKKFV